MEAIKTKGIARNGKLTVSVPLSFNEQELEVIVLTTNHQSGDIDTIRHAEKVKRLMSIVGTAKHPDLSNDVLDVYEQ